MRRTNREKNLSSIFCGELTAECLQNMEALATDRLPNEYLPCDFSTEQLLHKHNTF